MIPIEEIEEAASEHMGQLAATLSNITLEYLLSEKRRADRLQEEMEMLQSKVRHLDAACSQARDIAQGVRREKQMVVNKLSYYKSQSDGYKAEAMQLRKELNRQRKEQSAHGQARTQA